MHVYKMGIVLSQYNIIPISKCFIKQVTAYDAWIMSY